MPRFVEFLCMLILLSCNTLASKHDLSGKAILGIENLQSSVDINALRYTLMQQFPNVQFTVTKLNLQEIIKDSKAPNNVRYSVGIGFEDIFAICLMQELPDTSIATPMKTYKCKLEHYADTKLHDACKIWSWPDFLNKMMRIINLDEIWICEIKEASSFLGLAAADFRAFSENVDSEHIKAELLKLDELAIEIPLDRSNLKDCQCGLDITEQLKALRSSVLKDLEKKDDAQLREVCHEILSGDGWDIWDLAFTEGSKNHESESCGLSDTYCSSTVSIDGECHFAGEVNYFLWGLANSYCFKRLKTLSNSPIVKDVLVGGHRLFTSIWELRQLEVSGRLAWTKAGWRSLENIEFAKGSSQYDFPICSEVRMSPLDWNLGNSEENIE